jgi:hypothetical protein
MTVLRLRISIGLCLACLSGTVAAQELMVFPNNDQDKEQQQQDEFTCYNWAKDETGFDPMAVPTATEPPPQESTYKQGGVMRGAVRGAAVGGIVGDSDDAKKGAAAGAAVGGMRRHDQKRKEEAERQQWEQEQQQIATIARTPRAWKARITRFASNTGEEQQ